MAKDPLPWIATTLRCFMQRVDMLEKKNREPAASAVAPRTKLCLSDLIPVAGAECPCVPPGLLSLSDYCAVSNVAAKPETLTEEVSADTPDISPHSVQNEACDPLGSDDNVEDAGSFVAATPKPLTADTELISMVAAKTAEAVIAASTDTIVSAMVKKFGEVEDELVKITGDMAKIFASVDDKLDQMQGEVDESSARILAGVNASDSKMFEKRFIHIMDILHTKADREPLQDEYGRDPVIDRYEFLAFSSKLDAFEGRIRDVEKDMSLMKAKLANGWSRDGKKVRFHESAVVAPEAQSQVLMPNPNGLPFLVRSLRSMSWKRYAFKLE